MRHANDLMEIADMERKRAKEEPTCYLAGPGRGDCEHFVGLHGQQTDEYGKPIDWCWWCWISRKLTAHRALVEAANSALRDAEDTDKRLGIARASTRELRAALSRRRSRRERRCRVKYDLEDLEIQVNDYIDWVLSGRTTKRPSFATEIPYNLHLDRWQTEPPDPYVHPLERIARFCS